MHTLPVMKLHERKFIHELASYYGLATQSHDTDAQQRSVCVYACKEKCFIPAISLSQSIDSAKAAKYTSAMPRLTNLNKLNSTTRSADVASASSSSSKFALLTEEANTASSWHALAHRTHSDDDDEPITFNTGTAEAAAADSTMTTTTTAVTGSSTTSESKKPIDYFDFS